MMTSHAILLRLWHDPQFEFERVEVEYLDRGAPGDRSRASGGRIISLDHGGMEIKEDCKSKFVPFHRIRRIFYDDRVLWERVSQP